MIPPLGSGFRQCSFRPLRRGSCGTAPSASSSGSRFSDMLFSPPAFAFASPEARHPRSGRGGGLAAEEGLVWLKDRFPASITWGRAWRRIGGQLAANRAGGPSRPVRSGTAAPWWPGWCGAGDVGSGWMCGTDAPIGGLPMCVAHCERTPGCRCARRSRRPRSRLGWPSKSWRCYSRRSWRRASARRPRSSKRRRQVIRHWEQRIERARYEADRAARQYQACEPENRLVARTLERPWEEAFPAVHQLETEFDRFRRMQPQPLDAADRERIRRLAGEVPALWRAATTTPADRRPVVRLLVDRVVPTVDPGDDRVAVRVESGRRGRP